MTVENAEIRTKGASVARYVSEGDIECYSRWASTTPIVDWPTNARHGRVVPCVSLIRNNRCNLKKGSVGV